MPYFVELVIKFPIELWSKIKIPIFFNFLQILMMLPDFLQILMMLPLTKNAKIYPKINFPKFFKK